MALRFFWRWVKEAIVNLVRNLWLATSAVGMIAVAVFLLGFIVLLALNAAHFARTVEKGLEIAVFLKDGLKSAEREELARKLAQIEGVAKVEFVSRQEALEKLRRELGENSDLLRGLDKNNPLPDSFRLFPKQPQLVPLIAKEAAALPGVEKVRYGEGVVEKLLRVTNWIRWAAAGLVLLFAVAAVFLTVTTIRLSILSRGEEISIMKLLGATNWFVRGPFVCEGLLIGFLGAGLATGFLAWGYWSLLWHLEETTLFFFRPVSEARTLITLYLSLLFSGVLLGGISSFISVRRFLAV
ncbi:permease-like cell division protein FtsX [Ammonifex thiophilus]|uniref:Cell division protein FtsX n=1 Tax=Ammonifex thiophilus TaxID=444093 RepID=A0A3D8P240_9THEO|nr:permease-like cell division protein FtsX [Ammonifex thiophilus]RDV82127.1 ABC transporter permease [Ammonifex thiophilus]